MLLLDLSFSVILQVKKESNFVANTEFFVALISKKSSRTHIS